MSARAALAIALGVIVGVLIGHFAWTSGRNFRAAVGSAPAEGGHRHAPSLRSAAHGRSARSAHSQVAVSKSTTTQVSLGLVDIDTELGIEGGEAAGTGMVLTPSGEVITNNHVIAGATSIRATDVGNGATYKARVVGYDYSRDVAVLQIEGASQLETVTLGDSRSAKRSERIATIGNAGGRNGAPSVASGTVHAVDRSIAAGDDGNGTVERLTGMIELAGKLEPGDSGGPLVNASGEVLGMDTAASGTFRLRSSGDEGFAIPIDDVKAIAAQILANHSSSTIHIGATGFLGVLVDARGDEGAFVESVVPRTPAAASGLSAGDIITAIDGRSVSSPGALTHLMLQHRPGEAIEVTWRSGTGASRSATVTLATGPAQ